MRNPQPISQTTLSRTVACNGIGLHNGIKVRMRIHPAPVNTGIVFCLKQNRTESYIPALWHNVAQTNLRTVIRNKQGAEVATIEHLMAAFAGMGVDNAIVELNQGEVPIMDGSALHFCDMINRAGILIQEEPAQVLEIPSDYTEYKTKDRRLSLSPSTRLRIWCSIDYPSPFIGDQNFVYHHESPAGFYQEIAPARTFCFKKDLKAIRAHGLGLGGSLESSVVISGRGIENKGGLRFPNEPARHKVLDCIGDLALCGKRVIGEVRVCKGGHLVHVEFLRRFLANLETTSTETPAKAPTEPTSPLSVAV